MGDSQNKIFLLAVKTSGNKNCCIGVYKIGTDKMEFIVGKTEESCHQGEEVAYISDAEYIDDLAVAMEWYQKL